MNATHLLNNKILRTTRSQALLNFVSLILLFTLFQLPVWGQSANIDQGANDKATTPLTPVDWINGNLNTNTAHFLEGYSVPYRAVLKSLVVNQTYTLVIGFDIKNSGKHALDYLTHYQRLLPHTPFGHAAETVNPLLNIAGFPVSYFTTTDTEPIPAPGSTGSPVAGQPTTSFNALPAGERVFTGYNADLLSVTYNSQGDLNASQSEALIYVTFKALKETVVLAWGGHIASIVDWGKEPGTGEPRSASAISGSPYHMSLKNWIINGSVVSIGNQDRSLKTDAVFIPPQCEVAGPVNGCVETTKLVYTSTVDDPVGLTYSWSIIGANTANAKIVNATLANIEVVPIGAAFIAGSFNLRLVVTREGLKDTCYLNSHINPGATVNISQVTVNAGVDQNITHLDVASLSASASGGTAPYTFSWTPVTGLSNPNIFNPTFTPPSTGVFQFIVKAVDANNCQDVDTVVVTVTEHPKPPCGITGSDPVCPGSKNEYAGPPAAQVGSYLWSVTGDASVSGDNDKEKVWIQADNKCGSYLIKLIVSTPDGKRKDTCYKQVVIKDTIKPILSGNVAGATVGCAKDIPAPPNITATDNCTAELNIESSAVVSDSTCVNKYKITRKWWATDVCGNTSEVLIQVITVNDDVKPVITADFDKSVSVQCLQDVPAVPEPTASDNCNGNITPVYTEVGAGTGCDSTITRKWVFTDACGNSDSVTQVITIKDDVKPVLNGTAPDANVTCTADVPVVPEIGATDNCGTPKVHYTQEVTDSTCVNKYKITRKWWATDVCGNTSDVLTQVITVNDDVKPVITADFDKSVNVQCLQDVPAVPEPTATDNCNGNITPVYTELGAGTGCDSTITRKWVFTDACGNSDSVTQVITIKDDVKPVLNGTAPDANVTCTADVPVVPEIGATDNCGTPKVHYSQEVTDSTCVNKYKITRKWWATDVCGNTSDVLIQVITVNDDVKPVITADFDKAVSVQCLQDVPAAPEPTATDNCNGNITPVYTVVGTGTGCDSTITRKWVFTDACGNSDSVTQVITIKDDVKPVLNGTAPDANVTCTADVPVVPEIGATDNCGIPTVHYTQEVTDSTCVNKYKITRKWWATDVCGNTSDVLIQVITVNDDVKPVITADFDKSVNVQCLQDVPAAPEPTATDNCNGNITPVYTEVGAGTGCDSTITRKWVFTDACGNSDSVTQVITIKDDVKPVLNGTAPDANVTCTADVPVVPEIGATDNCGIPTVHYTQEVTDSTCVNKYKITRKWWATDVCGNISDVLIQVITVHDDVKPVITADFDKAVNIKCLQDIPTVPNPTAADNCNGNITPVYTEVGAGTGCDSTITRKWVFTDACGNSDSVTQVITIKDDVKPVLNGTAPDANVTCTADVPVVPEIGATDNCGTPKVHYTQEVTDSTCVNKYKITRKWWAADVCGNISDVLTQVITVNDDVKPVITADFDKSVSIQCLQDVPAAPEPTATDNCNGNITPVYTVVGTGTGCDSTITRKWVFTDACGNSDSVTQVITIKDDVKPVLNGTAPDANVTCTADVPVVPEIGATDNCGTPKVHYTQEVTDSTCVNKYKITRKWWATDICGNTSDVLTQVITVNDDVKPVITADFDKSVSVQCLQDVPAAPEPMATDNCNGNITPVYTVVGTGTGCDSTITRKWVFTDACGNSDSVTQVITIKDDVKPVLNGTAPDANVTCTADVPVVPEIGATDNCGTPKVHYTQEVTDSTCVNKYKITRKWWATDVCGNISDVLIQVITVNDDVKPVITADFDKSVNVQCLQDVPAAPEPTATDNCNGNITPVYTEVGAGIGCDSTITRKWVFTDACGNSDSVTQIITIKDDVKPVLNGTAPDANVTCTADVPVVPEIGATDNCGTPKVHYTQEVTDSTCVNKYKITRKWWATDVCGNTSDVLTQVITVNDDVKPVITADFDKSVSVQCLQDVPAAPEPTATDNCNGNITPVYTELGAGTGCDSTITRKWVFTDACGNSDSVTQVITIKDDVKPVLNGTAPDANVTCTADVPVVPEIGATDNCGTPKVHYTQEVTDSTCVNKYKITRKWWATDICGNTSDVLTQVITVNDDVKPVITADFEKTIYVQCLNDVPVPPRPTATDNCNGEIPAVCSAEGSGTACDSTITRKWVFTDDCGNSDSVTQIIRIKDNIAPVLSGTATDINVKCTADIPGAAAIDATDNCGTPKVYFKQIVSDSTCLNRYKVVRKWWAKDACGNTSDTLKQVINVFDDVKPVITANFEKSLCVQCVKDLPAVPTPTAKDNCTGNITPVYTVKGSGTACDSTITRKWVFTDACGNKDSVAQVIKVKDTTAPVVTYKPANATLPCGSTPVFGTPTFTDNCGGKVKVTYVDRKEGTKCPFTYIRRWTATDACNNSKWVEQAIVVECCKQSFCSYTQGFYGNTNGKGCTPAGANLTSKQMMTAAVDAQPGDSVIFGLKATGKFFTLFLSNITNDNIYKMLPGGGTAVALKGYATYSKINTWGNVPLITSGPNTGKINNILLAQTMTLFFNMQLSATLKDLAIEGDSLFTSKLIACGSTIPSATVDKYVLPLNVVIYLKLTGKANIAGLYELANRYLGGQTVPAISISDVNKAVDAINNAFDKCAVLVRWAYTSNQTCLKPQTTTMSEGDMEVFKPSASEKLEVNVYPNPYRDKLIFRFTAPETGKVKLEVYNMLGQQTGQLNYGTVEKGTTHTVEYSIPSTQRTMLIYKLSVGSQSVTGKAIPYKE
ncbi:T9SS type A sorting domain-containing protein [Chitinophaga tropicalis]|uniref:HYR-like domain-containing protein n=1 Tax=Chitinophaga tropicalis TaxID=2683588 RepID=A0A7K1U7I1_9BACT|nr:T9SS type A sorting domain-containing protein [Chitinophaga tropicalis]MVT10311.1 hypothetical protein [Chitinophaga tropicalis]